MGLGRSREAREERKQVSKKVQEEALCTNQSPANQSKIKAEAPPTNSNYPVTRARSKMKLLPQTQTSSHTGANSSKLKPRPQSLSYQPRLYKCFFQLRQTFRAHYDTLANPEGAALDDLSFKAVQTLSTRSSSGC